MPRASAEARSAAAWREGGQHPKPPAHLSRDAKVVWKDIVGTRPVDFFAPGSLHLLEQFCAATVAQRANMAALEVDPTDHAAIERFAKLGTLLNTTAQKLRLSIQSALRTEDRKNDERESAKSSLLGGGGVVALDRKRKAS